MRRQEFLKVCGLLGISLPFQHVLTACSEDNMLSAPYSGKVIIIGAGAGGLSAGYLLKQQGTDVEILEASSAYGGRMRISDSFADFPIPLGAEWIETNEDVFENIVNNPSLDINIDTIVDRPDRKFVNYSWYHFYEDYIIPHIVANISFDTIVESIDYTGDKAIITTPNQVYEADKIIVSAPLMVLKEREIRFYPDLPQSKWRAIQDAPIWEGFKAFFEFKVNFYGDEEYVFTLSDANSGNKLFYNAALGQKSDKNIMGIFAVGAPAKDYISRSDDELKNFILRELDAIYDNQASVQYLRHITQNWSDEPFIKGAYLSDHADWKVVRELGKSVAQKLYFAGGAYTDGQDWVSVHTAAQSAKRAIEEINQQ